MRNNVISDIKVNKELKDGIVGLKNNSLYCYMNACLQCFLPIEEFRDYMIQDKFERFRKTKCIDNHMDYLVNIKWVIDEAFSYDSGASKIINPTGLKNIIRKKFFPTMQHDSHEFLMHVLGSLQDEETPLKNRKFNGDVTQLNKNRTMSEIYDEYFEANPSIVDYLFTGI